MAASTQLTIKRRQSSQTPSQPASRDAPTPASQPAVSQPVSCSRLPLAASPIQHADDSLHVATSTQSYPS